jgi:excisionase family DNA binding protein
MSVYPALLTVEEVAEKLGISKYQVYRRIDRGDLRVTPFRRQRPEWKHPRLLIAAQEVQEYTAAGRHLTYVPKMPGEWMSTREVGEVLGISPDRVRELCNEGALVWRKGRGVRGQYRVRRDSVNSMLNSDAVSSLAHAE